MTVFADRLLCWYDAHGRKDLPWQQGNAYGIWVSEIMLQQTQVRTVIPYFERFVERFPDVTVLADAPLDAVLRRWSGLGYYARARNLHAAAQTIRDAHGGVFPRTFDDVVALPGVGRSTAGAILALAFGQRHAILDGNAKRVLARHAAIGGWPGKTAVANALWKAAEENTPDFRVADYTQAIMDLGATLCTRSDPACETCPVTGDCRAFLEGSTDRYPGRKARSQKPLKQTTMVIAVSGDTVFLERRPAAGIWGGLWSLPEMAPAEVSGWCRRVLRHDARDVETWDVLRHSFSHYDLDIAPVVVRGTMAAGSIADTADTTWFRLDREPPGGMAAPVQKLIARLRAQSDVTNR